LVFDTFENPHQRIPGYKGRRIYQVRYFDAFKNRELLIRVITEIRGDDLIIISIFKTFKLAKYWSEA